MQSESDRAEYDLATKGLDTLKRLLNEFPESGEPAQFKLWHRSLFAMVEYIFGPRSTELDDLKTMELPCYCPPRSTEDSMYYEEDLAKARTYIQELVNVQEYKIRLFAPSTPERASFPETATALTSDVFIVHGHDNAPKEEVARFLEKGGLNAIILHEKPNEGKTIIEKFESNTETACFAVILLTPDDVGLSKKEYDAKPDKNNPAMNSRARQNVVFEFGYFVGKLGRSRVCPLLVDGVEKPSDIDGVGYVSLTSGWRRLLAREIAAAGVPFNSDRALGVRES
ncbi:nucleotide-binding protein [bacterium]|nr:nucleotide-binding protein [bacterium]